MLIIIHMGWAVNLHVDTRIEKKVKHTNEVTWIELMQLDDEFDRKKKPFLFSLEIQEQKLTQMLWVETV